MPERKVRQQEKQSETVKRSITKLNKKPSCR